MLLVGISFAGAPVAVRERFALGGPKVARFLNEVVSSEAIDEAVAISTCNRTEIYVATHDPVSAEAELLDALAARGGVRPAQLAQLISAKGDRDAARHLFRVVSGLESMVVGESEVQGQVKRAYESARQAGTTGPLLNRLFASALRTGKRVRSETRVGMNRTSVSSVAADLATDVVGGLSSANVVIIGAGRTAELTARALAARGATTICITSRTVHRARSLADRCGCSAVSIDELPTRLAEADVVISATSSAQPIVAAAALEPVMRERAARPLVLIDIAVPRDVEAACGEMVGVTLFDIDDLQAVVARNLSVRNAERVHAEAIIDDEIMRLVRWLGEVDVRPTVGALRAHGAAIVESVLAENAGRWESASPRDLARIEALARAVIQRLLHEPTARLKDTQRHGDANSHARLELVRELFALDEARTTGHLPDEAAVLYCRSVAARR